MNLEAVLEGMLFIAGEDGLSYEQIINILEIDKEIPKGINEITTFFKYIAPASIVARSSVKKDKILVGKKYPKIIIGNNNTITALNI